MGIMNPSQTIHWTELYQRCLELNRLLQNQPGTWAGDRPKLFDCDQLRYITSSSSPSSVHIQQNKNECPPCQQFGRYD